MCAAGSGAGPLLSIFGRYDVVMKQPVGCHVEGASYGNHAAAVAQMGNKKVLAVQKL